MTKKIGKVKKQVKTINRDQKKLEAESHDVPRTMIFCKSGASAIVRQLVEDFKSIMEPYTTTTLKCTKKNKMKDFIDHAGPLNVKNIIYFTETSKKPKISQSWNESTNYEIGGVYCHIICVPHGPTFTYKLKEYSLKKDIQNVSGFSMNNNWLQQPPLLILNGFSNREQHRYIDAVSSSWQNMLPKININKTRIRNLRRAVLLSRHSEMPEADDAIKLEFGEVFVLRHYNIRLESGEINKNVKKLGVGAVSRNVKIPNLSKYSSIEDFVSQSGGYASESDMSDIDEAVTVELVEKVKELPGSSGKTAVKMMEVGPRMTLQLLKIENGVHSGAVIYHRYITKTAEEVFKMEEKRQEKLRLKEQRRKEQAKNVEEKKKKDDGKGDKKKKKKEEDDSASEIEEEINTVEEEEHNIVEEEENDSEGIEDIEDSLDGEENDEIENVDDSMNENVDDSMNEDDDDIEDVNDSMDEEEEDEEDDDDEESIEEVKPVISKKRTLERTEVKNKKRKL